MVYRDIIKNQSDYERRPDKCNVDKTYDIHYKYIMSRDQYYELNYEACRLLKKDEGEECI